MLSCGLAEIVELNFSLQQHFLAQYQSVINLWRFRFSTKLVLKILNRQMNDFLIKIRVTVHRFIVKQERKAR